ncbi:MAG: hypothetical protein K8T25_14195 [Planctomycetia bacterium]|nr:hypothetical protein [Planctomycetia bacterium]
MPDERCNILAYFVSPARTPQIVRRIAIVVSGLVFAYVLTWLTMATFFSEVDFASGHGLWFEWRSPPHENYGSPFHALFEPAYRLDESLRPRYWHPMPQPMLHNFIATES